MKKILLIVLSVVFIASSCFGWGGGGQLTQPSRWKSYVIENPTGAEITTAIPTTTIIPNSSVILGYEVIGRATGNSEVYIALVDGVGVSDEVIAEAEAGVGYSVSFWFPRPRIIETGLTVTQGANTNAIIYFE